MSSDADQCLILSLLPEPHNATAAFDATYNLVQRLPFLYDAPGRPRYSICYRSHSLLMPLVPTLLGSSVAARQFELPDAGLLPLAQVERNVRAINCEFKSSVGHSSVSNSLLQMLRWLG